MSGVEIQYNYLCRDFQKNRYACVMYMIQIKTNLQIKDEEISLLSSWQSRS